MGISSGVVSRLCKHNKLIEKIFGARMLIQPFDSFSEIERDEIEVLLEESTILRKDADSNIWLNPDVEKAFETMLGSGDNIDLGRIGEYLVNIEFEMKSYLKLKRDSRITSIIKNFNNIILLLEDNSKLVTKKRESDYGGYTLHIEKVGYLQHLLHQTQRLSNEIDGISNFIATYKNNFRSLENETLRKKNFEVRYTIIAVRNTLSNEMYNIGALLKIANREVNKNEILEKLKIIDFLLSKGRFLQETNYKDLTRFIPTTYTIEIKTHLNGLYADNEEYRERILALSQRQDASLTMKKKERSEAKARTRTKTSVSEDYIDPYDIYNAYLDQDKSLIHFIESIDFGDTKEDRNIDVYLEVLGEYHKEMHIPIPAALEDTNNGEFEVLVVKENREELV